MFSAEESVMKPRSIISYEVNCQTLKPENTFVFVVLSAQVFLADAQENPVLPYGMRFP